MKQPAPVREGRRSAGGLAWRLLMGVLRLLGGALLLLGRLIRWSSRRRFRWIPRLLLVGLLATVGDLQVCSVGVADSARLPRALGTVPGPIAQQSDPRFGAAEAFHAPNEASAI